MMNQKEFAKNCSVNVKTVKGWYEKGYLPGAYYDEKSHEFQVDPSTPRPYGIQAKVANGSTLILDILKAADMGNSVHENMFPKIDTKVFQNRINELIEENYVEVIRKESDMYHLAITSKGVELKQRFENASKKELAEITDGIKTGLSIVEILIKLWPYLEILKSVISPK